MRVSESVEIRRPPAEVFAFLADVSNLPRWQPSVKEVSADESLSVGTRFDETRQFMGRRVRSTLEVTVLEPERELSLRAVDGPVALTVRHLLEPARAGTRLTLEADGDPGALFRFAARAAARAAARQARHDLDRLRHLLETP